MTEKKIDGRKSSLNSFMGDKSKINRKLSFNGIRRGGASTLII